MRSANELRACPAEPGCAALHRERAAGAGDVCSGRRGHRLPGSPGRAACSLRVRLRGHASGAHTALKNGLPGPGSLLHSDERPRSSERTGLNAPLTVTSSGALTIPAGRLPWWIRTGNPVVTLDVASAEWIRCGPHPIARPTVRVAARERRRREGEPGLPAGSSMTGSSGGRRRDADFGKLGRFRGESVVAAWTQLRRELTARPCAGSGLLRAAPYRPVSFTRPRLSARKGCQRVVVSSIRARTSG